MTRFIVPFRHAVRGLPVFIPLTVASLAPAQAIPPPPTTATDGVITAGAASPSVLPGFEGYDFEHVVDTLQASVDPLAAEMNASFVVFVEEVDRAVELMEDGRTREAIEASVVAIDGVMAVRDGVLDPMWEAQTELTSQIAEVRSRLARAISRTDQQPTTSADGFSPATERLLNGVAERISTTEDPVRQKRLIAHYRTIRSLARVKRAAERMSPDQRRL